MDRITRKELKTDKFALEVEHGVEYVAEHKQQVARYGAIGAAVLVAALAIYGFMSYRSGVRADALRAAMQMQESVVGQPGEDGRPAFPTAEAKDAAVKKALADVAEKYAGSEEAAVAHYYLGTAAADKGDLAGAEKHLRDVVANGGANYASLAKLSLASILQAENKAAEGEQMLRSLLNSPTAFVSKEQAAIVLAKYVSATNPAEARKLLEPLRTSVRTPISRAAITALGELPAK